MTDVCEACNGSNPDNLALCPPHEYEDVRLARICRNCAMPNSVTTWRSTCKSIRTNRASAEAKARLFEHALAKGKSVDEAKQELFPPFPTGILYPINRCLMNDQFQCLWFEQEKGDYGRWMYAVDLFGEQITNGGQWEMAALNQCYRLATYRMTEAAKGLNALFGWLYGSKTKKDARLGLIKRLGYTYVTAKIVL